jgi:glycosyltransferase involved in cell wall biosynthesis
MRNLYAGSDVVVIPSVPTRDFLEPWGLVVNEAFHQGVPVIATDAVGAAAGGLVRHERTGLVVPAGDAAALSAAIERLRDDPALRRRLGEQARADAGRYTPAAWAEGMSRALASAHGKAC